MANSRAGILASFVLSLVSKCVTTNMNRQLESNAAERPTTWPSNYDVVWTERRDWSSAGVLGSMPIGSGMTGANVWIDDDAVRLLLAHTDSYDEFYLLMKLGQIAIELDPNPFAPIAPPPPPPLPPFPGNRSSISSYQQIKGVIGCASASGCVDPHNPDAMRVFNCSSAAACKAEAAAACGHWSECTSFSISDKWNNGAAAQMFSCAREVSSAGWNSWKLTNSTCKPAPPKRYPPFEQRLSLADGMVTFRSTNVIVSIFADWHYDVIRIKVNSTDGTKFSAKIRSENWRNVSRSILGGELQPLGVCLGEFGVPGNITRKPDTTVHTDAPELAWYRRNPARTIVQATMEQQLLPQSALYNNDTGKHLDILANNTFGVLVQGVGGSSLRKDSTSQTVVETTMSKSSLELQITANVQQTTNVAVWEQQVRAKALGAAKVSFDDALTTHAAHWSTIWARSWMDTGAQPGTEAYNQSLGIALGRYVNLCQGRGKTPTHFTGGIFFDANIGGNDYDYRSWGAAYWWQNTRFAYDAMIADGDFDHLSPMMEMYASQMPVSRALVKQYYHHEGVKFYETTLPWGATVMDQWGCANTVGADCGCYGNCTAGKNPNICRPKDLYERGVCNRTNATNSDCDEQNPYIRHHFSSALEVPLMMLRAFLVTGNATAASHWLVPVASETMLFFHEHWTDAEFFLEDAQALETYSHCDQPSCQVAGMRQLLRGLLLPQVKILFPKATLKLFEAMYTKLLGIKLAVFTTMQSPHHAEKFTKQSQLPLLAPCSRGGDPTQGYQPPAWTQQNREPVAMYAVWPYELLGVNRSNMQDLVPKSIGLDSDEQMLAFARASYSLQPYPGHPEGYNMISVFSANLGLPNVTRQFLNYKWSDASKASAFDYQSSRFPVWWGPSSRGGEVCDDPGCNEIADEARIALQHMLLQSDNHGERLLLFPAWPVDAWPNLKFKIHAERNTTLQGELQRGKLVSLVVMPPQRRKAVVVLLPGMTSPL